MHRNLFKLLPVALACGCSTTSDADLTASMYGYPLDADYAVAATAYDTGMYGYDPLYPVPLPAPDDGSADDPVSAIRAAANGGTDVCPGEIQVDPRYEPSPCAVEGQPADIPVGAAIWFNQCKLRNGAVLDGKVETTTSRLPSDETCNTITVTFAATFSDFWYVAPSGKKTVLSSMQVNGQFDHALGAMPQIITAKLDADIQRYDARNNLTSDRRLTGNITSALSGSPRMSITQGTLMASTTGDNSTAIIQLDRVQHDTSCCHATAGQVNVTTVNDSQSMEFGPSCGEATRNGQTLTLDECP